MQNYFCLPICFQTHKAPAVYRLRIKQPLIDSFATKKKPNQTHMATLLHLSGAPAAIRKKNALTIRSVDTHLKQHPKLLEPLINRNIITKC